MLGAQGETNCPLVGNLGLFRQELPVIMKSVIMNAKFIQSNEATHECVTDICCTKNSEITSDKETAKNVLFLI